MVQRFITTGAVGELMVQQMVEQTLMVQRVNLIVLWVTLMVSRISVIVIVLWVTMLVQRVYRV